MTIWKYRLEPFSNGIEMPIYARPLSVGLDPDGFPVLWCIVNENSGRMIFTVNVAVTGGPVPRGKFIGSFVKADFVGHVFFEEPNYAP